MWRGGTTSSHIIQKSFSALYFKQGVIIGEERAFYKRPTFRIHLILVYDFKDKNIFRSFLIEKNFDLKNI